MSFELIKQLNEATTNTSLTPEEIISNSQNASEFFNTEMSKDFNEDDFFYKAQVTKILGSVLTISFYDKHAKVTRHNSPVLIDLMMHLTDNKGKLVNKDSFELELTTMSHNLKNAGVKFRKIKGKTPTEVIKKALMWFRNNSPLILETFNNYYGVGK